MSLQLAANHLAAQGRGPDTTLVHMSPREVAGLQALARAHGGSLTINPQTGLPEAGFLDKLLPTIIGAAVTAFTGIPAWQVALGVGGIEAARTGDLSKGIMAGFGAYTGANLGGALAGAGEAATMQEALAKGAIGPTEGAIGQALSKIPMEEAIAGASRDAVTNQLQRQALEETAQKIVGMSPFDKMSAGIQSLGTEAGRSALVSQLGGPTQAAITAAGVAAPLFAGESARAKMPQTTTPTAYITPYAFDPNTHELRSLGRWEASKFPGFAAEGGLQRLADGGMTMDPGATPSYQRASMSPGMLDFAQHSEPVVRMRDGGVAHFDVGGGIDTPSYSAQDLASAYQRDVVGGGMTEADFVNAYRGGASDADFMAARDILLGGGAPAGGGASVATAGGGASAAPAGGGISSLVNTGAAGTPAPTQIGNTGYSLTSGGNIIDSSGKSITTLASLSANAWDPANAALLQAISGSGYKAGAGQLTDLGIGNVGANLPLATAYNEALRTGDFTNLNNLLAQRGTSIEDAARTFNLGQKDVDYLKGLSGLKFAKEESEADRVAVTNLFRNVLGRDPDALALNYWASQLASGKSKEQVAKDFAASASTVLGRTVSAPTDLNKAYGSYTTPTGYTLTNPATLNRTIGDEWVQNVLGRRAMTDADKNSEWFKATSTATDANQMKRAYDAFLEANKVDKSKAPDWYNASKFALEKVVEKPIVPPTTTTTTTTTVGGDSAVTNRDYTMKDVRDAYVEGGGRIAMPSVNALAPDERPMVQNDVVYAVENYIAANPGATMAQITSWAAANKMPLAQVRAAVNEHRFNQLTGGSKSAYSYLMGRGAYPTNPVLPKGVPVGRSYAEAMGLKSTFQPVSIATPTATAAGTPAPGAPTGSYAGLTAGDKRALQSVLAAAQSSGDFSAFNSMLNRYHLTEADLRAAFPGVTDADIAAYKDKVDFYEPPAEEYKVARGGLLGLATGSISDLGDYSDGGRLLRGPGDGVSDSIPATIGGRRPARLADGEFVVPARIVSELGNGSTEAGAKKLYAMMDRIQAGRKKSVGKGKVAVNSRADKHLPA